MEIYRHDMQQKTKVNCTIVTSARRGIHITGKRMSIIFQDPIYGLKLGGSKSNILLVYS